MKKTILMSMLIVSIFLQVNAQKDKLNFGIKGGVNFANASGSGTDWIADEIKPRIGVLFGGFLEYGLTEKLVLQGEVFYSGQGIKGDYGDADENYMLALDYINVPLLAKYTIADRLSLEFGPQIGFLVSASTIEKEDGETDKEDWKEYYKSTDIGLAFGGSYEFKNHLGVNLRYTFGMTNLIEDDNWEDDLKNRVLSISLFYKF